MFTFPAIVRPSACDKNGRLKLFAAFQMFQDCSELWMESEPYLKQRYLEEGRAQLLASRQVQIVRVPNFGERLTVSTSIWECQPLFGYRNTIIRDVQGQPCYVTWSLGAFVDHNTGALRKLSQDIIDSLTYDEKYPMEYQDRKIVLPKAVEPEILTPVPVTRDDIDYNNHVNNAQYIRIALECVDASFEPKGVRVEWKRAAHLGDTLTPQRMVEDDKVFVLLHDQNQKLVTVVEFS